MTEAEIEFDKYEKKGAYHWSEIEGSRGQLNAYTLGRYMLAVDCLRAAGVSRGARVADIGCGDGALAGMLSRELDAEVVGIDPSAAAIGHARAEFARRSWRGEFVVGDAYATGLPDASFDAAISADVIEHVRHPDRLLAEARRILKPGGVFVVTTPQRVSERPLDPLHVQEWFPEEFAQMCATHFGPVEVHRQTHPVFWYELYRWAGGRFGWLVRLAINAAAARGSNPFLWRRPVWSLHTQQAVVLRKPR
ncbi:MAG: methyltransferase domain-containing protein [Alphaproteobacteria bacterium]|nr:methyltransferase domain-containing protein [Alphaproteobacteria bacterium]